MQHAIKTLFYFGPLLFGFGFLVPLSAQILEATGTSALGLSSLDAGLLIGGGLGILAQLRGRWI
ncbi:MAG: hypothetical protein AAFQ21_10915 [Pseudomonadota bacterium]